MDEELLHHRRELIVGQVLQVPIVFKNQIEHWPCRRWSLAQWADRFNSQKVKFRVGPITNPEVGPLWDHNCDYVEATVEDFLERHQRPHQGPFQQYPPSSHWVYADYKYMAHLFTPDNPIHQSVDWGCFGLKERGGPDSTLWLGERHSNTPCHYDTYGCNLVAQLIGCKRWVLFPPSSTPYLYPTRIPYEESSVFSRVNVNRPNLKDHPSFKLTQPLVVTLHPGDTLYVPPRWWHYVQSTSEVTLSINSWIELACDEERRLEEAISRALVTNFTLVYPMDNWMNPTEEWTSPDTNLTYIKHGLQSLRQKRKHPSDEQRSHLNGPGDKMSSTLEQQLDLCFGRDNYVEVQKMSFEDYTNQMGCDHAMETNQEATLDGEESLDVKEDFLNAVLHPDVVALICQKLTS